ncbi:MAG: PCRF domain-containing protein, partial [Acidobacteria bacterium]|nr:PCRF domain-containing protein [Acidobacteriota bacterium]
MRQAASAPDLWDDQDRALQVTRKLARYEGTINDLAELDQRIEDAEVLLEMAREENDAGSLQEVVGELGDLDATLAALERTTLFFGEYDDSTAIISINAGQGGVDAHDWAEMLFRMYVRYLDRSNFSYTIDDRSYAE